MSRFANFGNKLSSALRWGSKAIGTASKFGDKITRGFADGANWISRNSDKILSLAETAPGVGKIVRKFDGPIRAGIAGLGEAGKLADMSADVFGGISQLTSGRNRLEKGPRIDMELD